MKRLELVVTNGVLAGRRFSVGDGGIRLGRASVNDIHVPDEELSRNHCLFEPAGDGGIRVTDLGSANGTYVNGAAVGADPVVLRLGDVVEVGKLVISVVGDQPLGSNDVNLGLGDVDEPAADRPRRRSATVNVLWAVAVLAAIAAGSVFVFGPPSVEETAGVSPAAEPEPVVREFWYEKVEANSDGIFRFEASVRDDGQLRVTMDDTKENRHPVVAPKQLDERELAVLDEILSFRTLREIDREFAGAEPESQSLASWRMKVVYSSRVRTVSIVNTQEPEAFQAVRERLEAYVQNVLGIHALQYSRDKLVALADEALGVGQAKWDERDVRHGNLADAIVAYKEAIFYFDTLDPKPDGIVVARQGLEAAERLLGERFREQHFAADREIHTGNWIKARAALRIALELVPDRNDARNRETARRLVEVEKHMQKGDR